MKLHKLFAIVGPSGAGKTTLVNSVFDYDHQLVSFTTREPRKNEIDGQDYYFLTKKNVQEMKDNYEIAELVEYNSNYYGYTKNEINEKLGQHDCAAVVTVGGYKTLKRLIGADYVIPVFVYTNRENILKHMQNRIGLDTQENINKRLELYKTEMNNLSYFRHEHAILHDNSGLTVEQSINKFKKELNL